MKQTLTLFLLLIGIASFAQTKIATTDAWKHIGDSVLIQDQVYSVKVLDNGMTMLNLGGNFPNHLLVVMIPAKLNALFPGKPDDVNGNIITITGKLINYNGKPEIIVSNQLQIEFIPLVKDSKGKRPTGG
ncbi:MAG: hypothetical protein Q8S11_08000 [Daejeonella sp.]|uniref:hypothetical protein n=1 Tax=Daejeonella sp. TaxID=2805397 RepID=UPI002732BEA9|nr:hypothetical protein [Daejeonella sp.]MDP3468263.1 hypothetical protein [Daejeonella sp.]